MTSFERYQRVLRGEAVDFPPRTPILMQFAAAHIGRSYGDFVADHRVLVEANLRCAADFGMDQVSAISDPYREAAGFGARVEVRENGPICEPLLEDPLDLSALGQPDPEEAPRMRDRLDAIRGFRERVGGELSILGWVEGAAAEAGDLRGVENFLCDLLEEPEAAAELMDRCLETAISFARAQIAAGADTMGIGDALASQVSRPVYEALILPRQRRLIAAIREAGGIARVHICGDITHLLPGLATTGVQVIDVDSMVDLRVVRATLGEDVVIGANLDPVADVMQGRPEHIRTRLVGSAEACGWRFAVNAGCEIPPATPEANFRALCDPLRQR